MATPILVFQATSDDIGQDIAPTYTTLQQTFDTALWNALASEDPAKVQGIQWAGPVRVTRKVREAHLPGGVTSATSVLVYTGNAPSILLQSSIPQFQAFITGIQEAIRSALQGSYSATSKTVQVPVSPYDPSVSKNGPLTFWTSGDDASSHTRDRFPETNALGVVSADQNENAIGPNDPSLVPVAAPPVVPTGSLTAIEYILGAAAVIAVVYLAAPIVKGSQIRSAMRPGVRHNPRTRINPRKIPWVPIAAVGAVGVGAYILANRMNTANAATMPPQNNLQLGDMTKSLTSVSSPTSYGSTPAPSRSSSAPVSAPISVPPLQPPSNMPSINTPLTQPQLTALASGAEQFKYLTRDQQLAFVTHVNLPSNLITNDQKIAWVRYAADKIANAAKSTRSGTSAADILASENLDSAAIIYAAQSPLVLGLLMIPTPATIALGLAFAAVLIYNTNQASNAYEVSGGG